MKYISSLLLSAGMLVLGSGISVAQGQLKANWCVTDEHNEELKTLFPEQARERERMEAKVQEYLEKNPATANRQQSAVRVIPVVVHVITETGTGGSTKAQILNAVRIMNEDFRRQNADTINTRALFRPYAADAEVEFRMARIDPNGNCTEGIVRVASPLTNSANPRNSVKAVSYWPSDRYFNIWLVNSIYDASGGPGVVAGYAQFPGSGAASTYGFVSRMDAFGVGSQGLRVGTHELGHCFNLYHTFQGGCGSSCNNSGDLVCDTPPTSTQTFGCSTTQNSCSNDASGTGSPFTNNVVDMIENYMSYDPCQNMFTQGQRARMNASFNTYAFLQNLTSPANAIATGIASPIVQVCAPIASFTANATMACQGADVQFTDHSYNADVDNSWTWSWDFPGANPSVSSDQNPTVSYPAPGVYPVTLTVANSAGSNAVTRTNYIVVKPTSGETAPITETIEGSTFPVHPTVPDKSWEIMAGSTNTWTRFTGAGSQGSASSMRITNQFIGNTISNSLVSPAIDMTNMQTATLTFDVAYARSSSTTADQLKVLLSVDCGRTWTLRYAKAGATLATNGGAFVNSFVPSATQWRTESINIQSQFLNSSNLRIRFEAVSNQGNPIYIDNINITGIVLGLADEVSSSSVAVYPNPASESAVLYLNLQKPAKVSWQMVDMLGREVLNGQSRELQAGTTELPVSLAGLPAGVYMVRVQDGSSIVTRKLVKD